MENFSDFDMKNLFNGLTEGRELAKQLQIHLNVSSSSHKTSEVLVEKILNSYDQALSILKYGVACGETQQGGLRIGTSDSPRSNSGSPRSDGSDHEFKDQDTKEGSKKRKAMPRWTQKVQVAPGAGVEAHADGYSWRKYGQKDILGATYPRGYYRCTHRRSQGCLATKQVQRSDEDPTILEVAYKGMHTCSLGAKKDPKTAMDQEPNIAEKPQQILPQSHQSQPELLDFQTTDLDTKNETLQPLNNNPSSSSSRIIPENDVFSAEMMDTNIYYPSFMSSEPNYLTFLPSFMNGDYGSSSNIVHTSESNAQTVGIDYPFGQLDLDSNFPFDNPRYFP
ncbi:putative WRKY transcription factor 30 [Forsythia ovata]|uniref:WRKY transcription factor 30 n=1 Tax=Forsythia ovata TaxID=205694 RepID=A0ABD1WQM7_9LAMI